MTEHEHQPGEDPVHNHGCAGRYGRQPTQLWFDIGGPDGEHRADGQREGQPAHREVHEIGERTEAVSDRNRTARSTRHRRGHHEHRRTQGEVRRRTYPRGAQPPGQRYQTRSSSHAENRHPVRCRAGYAGRTQLAEVIPETRRTGIVPGQEKERHEAGQEGQRDRHRRPDKPEAGGSGRLGPYTLPGGHNLRLGRALSVTGKGGDPTGRSVDPPDQAVVEIGDGPARLDALGRYVIPRVIGPEDLHRLTARVRAAAHDPGSSPAEEKPVVDTAG